MMMTGVIFRRECAHLLRAPQTYGLLAILQALVAWQFLAQLDLFQQYLPRLRQLASPPDATQFVFLPTLQLMGLLLLVLIPLLTMASFAGLRREGVLTLYQAAPVSFSALIFGRLAALGVVLGLPWLCLAMMGVALGLGTRIDLGTLSAALLALALLMAAACAIGLWASARSTHPAVAGMLAFGVLLGLWLIDWNGTGEGVLAQISMAARFQGLASGELRLFDALYFVLLLAGGVFLALRTLHAEAAGLHGGGHRLARLSHAGLTGLGLAAGLTVGGWLAQSPLTLDVSAGSRHTLAPASMQALQALTAPVTVTAWLPPRHPALPTLHALFSRYQRHSDRLRLEIRDPASAPDEVRAGHLEEGTVVFSSEGRESRTTHLAEDGFTRALITLARGEGDWIAFVTGHGERSPERRADFDLEDWAGVLRTRGYKVQELDLDTFGVVPDNTALVVLASPVLELNPREREILTAWLARGGALLWMVEPDSAAAHSALAAALGLKLPAGSVHSRAGEPHGVKDSRLVVVKPVREHSAARGLKGICVLPNATALETEANDDWTVTPVLVTDTDAWRADAAGTVLARGTQTLAVALTRENTATATEQRLIVVGDGDFVSNTYLGNGDNQALATQWVDWLTRNEALLGIETRLAPALALDFAPWQQAAMALVFLAGLPLLFAGIGLVLRVKERHA